MVAWLPGLPRLSRGLHGGHSLQGFAGVCKGKQGGQMQTGCKWLILLGKIRVLTGVDKVCV